MVWMKDLLEKAADWMPALSVFPSGARETAQPAESGDTRGCFGRGSAGSLDRQVVGVVANAGLLMTISAVNAICEGARVDGMRHRRRDTGMPAPSIMRMQIGATPGAMMGMDCEAWPVQACVSRHMAG